MQRASTFFGLGGGGGDTSTKPNTTTSQRHMSSSSSPLNSTASSSTSPRQHQPSSSTQIAHLLKLVEAYKQEKEMISDELSVKSQTVMSLANTLYLTETELTTRLKELRERNDQLESFSKELAQQRELATGAAPKFVAQERRLAELEDDLAQAQIAASAPLKVEIETLKQQRLDDAETQKAWKEKVKSALRDGKQREQALVEERNQLRVELDEQVKKAAAINFQLETAGLRNSKVRVDGVAQTDIVGAVGSSSATLIAELSPPPTPGASTAPTLKSTRSARRSQVVIEDPSLGNTAADLAHTSSMYGSFSMARGGSNLPPLSPATAAATTNIINPFNNNTNAAAAALYQQQPPVVASTTSAALQESVGAAIFADVFSKSGASAQWLLSPFEGPQDLTNIKHLLLSSIGERCGGKEDEEQKKDFPSYSSGILGTSKHIPHFFPQVVSRTLSLCVTERQRRMLHGGVLASLSGAQFQEDYEELSTQYRTFMKEAMEFFSSIHQWMTASGTDGSRGDGVNNNDSDRMLGLVDKLKASLPPPPPPPPKSQQASLFPVPVAENHGSSLLTVLPAGQQAALPTSSFFASSFAGSSRSLLRQRSVSYHPDGGPTTPAAAAEMMAGSFVGNNDTFASNGSPTVRGGNAPLPEVDSILKAFTHRGAQPPPAASSVLPFVAVVRYNTAMASTSNKHQQGGLATPDVASEGDADDPWTIDTKAQITESMTVCELLAVCCSKLNNRHELSLDPSTMCFKVFHQPTQRFVVLSSSRRLHSYSYLLRMAGTMNSVGSSNGTAASSFLPPPFQLSSSFASNTNMTSAPAVPLTLHLHPRDVQREAVFEYLNTCV